MAKKGTRAQDAKSKADGSTDKKKPSGGTISGGATGAPPEIPQDVDAREYRLFQSLDLTRKGYIFRDNLLEVFDRIGLSQRDFRLRESISVLGQYGPHDRISYDDFCELIRPNILLIERALQGNMVIPDFNEFCQKITEIYQLVKQNNRGTVADYIPQLARVEPDQFAVSLCTVDGQQFSHGDAGVDFCVQSTCMPINYCLALEEHGDKYVHKYIGREPSGRIFNELALSDSGKPHNPMINAGAIMSTALIKPDLDIADRFDYVMDQWMALAGNHKPGFSNSVYLSERQTADRNFALGYYMRENKAFPEGTNLIEALEFYFQCCSIEVTAQMMSVVAATLANGGVCPTSGERVFKTKNVQHCLSLMYSCGMYDFSGEFAFTVGLPAKSGVSGALVVVVPNVMGLCLWAPRLDSHGNSVRGIEFCKRLVKTFNFHNYDNLTGLSEKIDPRQNQIQAAADRVGELIWAASKGDHGAIHRLVVTGLDLNGADYDLRTPLHLAAAEGREHVVQYFIEQGANLDPKDRWGGTPLDDAHAHDHNDVIKLLEAHGAKRFHTSVDQEQHGAEAASKKPTQAAESSNIVELIYAASRGDMQAIQRLVARGIQLDGADYDLRTPLHLAAAEGKETVVQYFIDQGLELSPRDRWGGTPLGDAIRHNHKGVAQLLEKHGAVK